MRAILRTRFGGPEVLVIREIPEPEPKDGYAVIQVKAFGINHAEMHMRKGEWAEIADVSGIECVGGVKSCPGGEFPVGTKVAALMGGLGRTINGSYAEYSRAPVTNVAAIMSTEHFQNLIIGRGVAGKIIAWTLAGQEGKTPSPSNGRWSRARAPTWLACPARTSFTAQGVHDDRVRLDPGTAGRDYSAVHPRNGRAEGAHCGG